MDKTYSLLDLFNLFKDDLNESDMLFTKINTQISSVLVKERLASNLSQSAFAEKNNVSQSLISRWESGDCNFTIKKLCEIAVALNLDLAIQLEQHVTEGDEAGEELAATSPYQSKIVFDGYFDKTNTKVHSFTQRKNAIYSEKSQSETRHAFSNKYKYVIEDTELCEM